ncbi:hypothetical protein V6N11_029207 [Hibiscus sabdariffa]|uniref:Uncharacterized protein n=2 Tax=Hibiscus sabdariffa TaxID=183260 RepID=A0ABR2GHR5_9ROSI
MPSFMEFMMAWCEEDAGMLLELELDDLQVTRLLIGQGEVDRTLRWSILFGICFFWFWLSKIRRVWCEDNHLSNGMVKMMRDNELEF